ncbi:hypothetical protein, partial [Streptomyces sp. NPDC097610]|uniref:hypothetical protein n=1 Tax=Streptomyces sp. NPDC097610 TaxID=3157227 RepID=UPI00331F0AB8
MTEVEPTPVTQDSDGVSGMRDACLGERVAGAVLGGWVPGLFSVVGAGAVLGGGSGPWRYVEPVAAGSDVGRAREPLLDPDVSDGL